MSVFAVFMIVYSAIGDVWNDCLSRNGICLFKNLMKIASIVCLIFSFLYGIAGYSQPPLKLEPFLSGLTRPVKFTHAQDSRHFVAEMGGLIKVVKNGIVQGTPFLDIRNKIHDPDWAGIFSIAFHPDYQINGYFYVFYALKGRTEFQVSRFSRSNSNADRADPAETPLFTIPYTRSLGHKGGDMAFGKDHYLYISTGDDADGGRQDPGDPLLNAQNLTNIFGKILRINVDGEIPVTNLPDKVWVRGLRNPWRISFDKSSGDLWIGDNGHNGWEEINFVASDGSGVRNFGWPYREGNSVFRDCACDASASFVGPRWLYAGFDNNGGSSASVMGGYVYRGQKYPSLQGWYLFGDYQSAQIGAISPVSGGFRGFLPDISFESLVSFGEDVGGELYVLSFFGGTISRIDIESGPLPVVLRDFTAKEVNCQVRIRWETSSEQDFANFELQRSVDGNTFETLENTKGSGGGAYSFIDEHPENGVNLYRLKMVDLDGSYTYSRIVAANYHCQDSFISLFPNPAMDEITVRNIPKGAEVKIYNYAGQLVLSSEPANAVAFRLELNRLPSGLFTVQIDQGGVAVGKRMRLIKK